MAKKTTSKYVDGFVIVIPKSKVAAYRKMAKMGAAAWKKFGALEYKECRGNDLSAKGPDGKPMPMNFVKMAKAKPTDTVWFSFITYKNKAHRDQVNKKVMAFMDKEYAGMGDEPMPFDMKKMAFGGFSVEVGW